MKFTVDPPELRTVSGKFSDLSSEYTDVYNSLMDSASKMGDAWKATDNLAFVEQITGFCDELEYMAKHLMQASDALKQQADNYETTRDNNIASVKQLAN